MRLPFVLALLCSTTPALAQQVEVVRPVPRAAGTHGWTIEVPTPGAVGSFEVLRGGRLPDAAAAAEAIPVEPPPAAPRSLGSASRTIQIAPVRPVEVAPVGLHGRSQGAADAHAAARTGSQPAGRDASTVRVQRGPFPQSLLSILGNPGDGAEAEQATPAAPARSALPTGSAVPAMPPGARVIRIR